MNKRKKHLIFIVTLAVNSLWNTACTLDSKVIDGVTTFEEIPVSYQHEWQENSHPFTGAAIIDVDGDGQMEIFVSGGHDQADALLGFRAGKLENIIAGTGLSNLAASYGPVSIDIDNDHDVDLIVARNDGLYLYTNENGTFDELRIQIELPENSVPVSVALSDIDHDGDSDLYINIFVDSASFRSGVFNDPEHAKMNIMLLNNGDLTFTDITKPSNTAGKQNTFLSVFTDLDNDGWQDLVIAQNTGEVEILRNNKDRTFSSVPSNSGFGFWMGLAVGDMDNDGDQDLFFSNSGDSIPAFLISGDIREDQQLNLEWLLLRNDGEFNFVDVTADYGITGEGFAWGAVFEDINLDGKLDLLVAQNYIKWPLHKLLKLSGRTYLQTSEGGKFQHIEAMGLENKFYGQSSLIADIDNDGRPDVLWLNMNGPVRAFLNRSSSNFFSVSVPERASLLGTRVRVETNLGGSYTKEIISSTGMLTDQSPDLVFGLGEGEQVKSLVIIRPDGETDIIEAPGLNSGITLQ